MVGPVYSIGTLFVCFGFAKIRFFRYLIDFCYRRCRSQKSRVTDMVVRYPTIHYTLNT